MLPHARPGGIAGLLELLTDRGGRDDLYNLADELAMDVDDLLPIVEAAAMLGFAVLRRGRRRDHARRPQVRRSRYPAAEAALPRGRAEAHRDPAAASRTRSHAKRDHAIAEEFFRDILDEHFSTEEVERQFETALNWGRYAEIFDYDSENGRLFHREDADVLPSAEEH